MVCVTLFARPHSAALWASNGAADDGASFPGAQLATLLETCGQYFDRLTPIRALDQRASPELQPAQIRAHLLADSADGSRPAHRFIEIEAATCATRPTRVAWADRGALDETEKQIRRSIRLRRRAKASAS
jgi:hypothetical protein